MTGPHKTPLAEIVDRLRQCAALKKCWSCGCYHGFVTAVERTLLPEARSEELQAVMDRGQEIMQPIRYDCLGCDICYPALASDALVQIGGESASVLTACPSETVKPRAGWPPLPGSYTPIRFRAPVAICTLTADALAAELAHLSDPVVAIVGTLQTENLGIERLIQNVLSNPNIRFLIVCGQDSQQAVGHLPGQALVALSANGLDGSGRIIGATGKRPVLRNVAPEAVDHFRRTVEVLDLIGVTDQSQILDTVRECASRYLGPAELFSAARTVETVRGYMPERMTPDPAGYFVIYPDRERRTLLLEHYRNDGGLTTVIEGATATELYIPAIARGLITRFDHAAYLGRELSRAEAALHADEPYVQDAAPELAVMADLGACECQSGSAGKT